MGVVLQEVAFPARAPDLRRIAEEVRARSGLEVSVTESGEAERGDIYDFHAQLAFVCAPEERIEVYTLRPGAALEPYKIAFADFKISSANAQSRSAGFAGKSAAPAIGLPEAEGPQVVYLKGLWEQELTLLFATQMALERLGGVSPFPLSDQQRSEYDRSLTAAELMERRRAFRVRQKWGRVLWVLLLPITIPWTLLKWIVIAIVPGVWKVGRTAKAALGSRGGPSEPRIG